MPCRPARRPPGCVRADPGHRGRRPRGTADRVTVPRDEQPGRVELTGGEQVEESQLGRGAGGEPPAGWEDEHVSTYATMHPWEDWAETFAHYLHIRDTEQTAAAYGLVVEGPDAKAPAAAPLEAVPSERPATFDEIVETWLPLTYALNAVNRSMGAHDLYPFVLPDAVVEKIAFMDSLRTR